MYSFLHAKGQRASEYIQMATPHSAGLGQWGLRPGIWGPDFPEVGNLILFWWILGCFRIQVGGWGASLLILEAFGVPKALVDTQEPAG